MQYWVLLAFGFTVIVCPTSTLEPFAVHVYIYVDEPPFAVASISMKASAQMTVSIVKSEILKGDGSEIVVVN